MNRKPIFDTVRNVLGRAFTQAEVDALDKAVDLSTASLTATIAPEAKSATTAISQPATSSRALGRAGEQLIKKWEGCAKQRADGRFDAYPDPGSADGKPWTIGWGSTGPDVRKDVIWTQSQCDERFDHEIMAYVNEVARFLGTAPTTQNQFDALVSFHYNTGAIAKSGLGKLHKQSRFAEAQAEFGKWIYNDQKPMNGLKSRRSDEARLYAKP